MGNTIKVMFLLAILGSSPAWGWKDIKVEGVTNAPYRSGFMGARCRTTILQNHDAVTVNRRVCLRGGVRNVVAGNTPIARRKIGSIAEICNLPERTQHLSVTATETNKILAKSGQTPAQITIDTNGDLFVSGLPQRSQNWSVILDNACFIAKPLDTDTANKWRRITLPRDVTGRASYKKISHGDLEMVCLDGRIKTYNRRLFKLPNAEGVRPQAVHRSLAATNFGTGDLLKFETDGTVSRSNYNPTAVTHLSGQCYFTNPCGTRGWSPINEDISCDDAIDRPEMFLASDLQTVFFRGKMNLERTDKPQSIKVWERPYIRRQQLTSQALYNNRYAYHPLNLKNMHPAITRSVIAVPGSLGFTTLHKHLRLNADWSVGEKLYWNPVTSRAERKKLKTARAILSHQANVETNDYFVDLNRISYDACRIRRLAVSHLFSSEGAVSGGGVLNMRRSIWNSAMKCHNYSLSGFSFNHDYQEVKPRSIR